MNNKVIKVLSIEHGKKVIEFFKQYCDTGGLSGTSIGRYYGIIDGEFNLWTIDKVQQNNAEIIVLHEDMNNKVIKVLDREHGKRVIEFWKQFCDTRGLGGDNVGSYYGVINERFDFWDIDEVKTYNAEIIELPEEKTYPRVMLVSDDNINWDKKRVVFMEKCGGFMAWGFAKTLEEAETKTSTTFWEYAKEIEQVEVTLEEIANWKGVHKEQIIIK